MGCWSWALWLGESLGKAIQGFGVSMLWTEMLNAVDGVTKYDGSDVGGTWLQLMCCTLPKRLCPQITSGLRTEIGQRLLELGRRCCFIVIYFVFLFDIKTQCILWFFWSFLCVTWGVCVYGCVRHLYLSAWDVTKHGG